MSLDKTIVYSKAIATAYEVYLNSEVESDIFVYQALLHLLNERVTEFDEVTLYLSNYGGSCQSCVAICNAMLDCVALIKVKVIAPCYSAASTIALCGDRLELAPHSFLMFHNYSSSTQGKGGELIMAVKETNQWINDYFKALHYPFLSKVEIQRLINDQDIYIKASDKSLSTRIKRHFKHGL